MADVGKDAAVVDMDAAANSSFVVTTSTRLGAAIFTTSLRRTANATMPASSRLPTMSPIGADDVRKFPQPPIQFRDTARVDDSETVHDGIVTDRLGAAARWLIDSTTGNTFHQTTTASTHAQFATSPFAPKSDVSDYRRSAVTDFAEIIERTFSNISGLASFENRNEILSTSPSGRAAMHFQTTAHDAFSTTLLDVADGLFTSADAFVNDGFEPFVGGNSTEANRSFGGAMPTLRHSHVAYTFLTCVVLGAIILATIVGNAFVIAAIVLERNLHSVANYLIASLSVADLMVAALVMPLAAVNEVSAHWFLGVEACDAFISFDVLCCTASILHLVAISVDRYWAVTRVDYIHNRPVGRIVTMIALSWGISTVISIPPLFGWKSPDNDPALTGVCLISQDWGYTVYSTLGAFYIPLAFMIVIYLNVYRAARSRIRKRQFRLQRHAIEAEQSTWMSSVNNERVGTAGGGSDGGGRSNPASTPLLSLDTPTSPCLLLPPDVCSDVTTPPLDGVTSPMLPSTPLTPLTPDTNGSGSGPGLLPPWSTGLAHRQSPSDGIRQLELSSSQRLSTERRAKKKREQNRERKAARTLGIVTGSFVTCWLPFFILALVRPFCGERCHYPPLLVSVIGWLGYFNSLLNPIIYTIFNPDFRSAFRKILFGKYRGRGTGAGSTGGGRRARLSLNGVPPVRRNGTRTS